MSFDGGGYNVLLHIVKYCSLRSQCEMKFATFATANISHLRSKYFTAQLFHLPEGQISLKKVLRKQYFFLVELCPQYPNTR